jgi:hypothetical protein
MQNRAAGQVHLTGARPVSPPKRRTLTPDPFREMRQAFPTLTKLVMFSE